MKHKSRCANAVHTPNHRHEKKERKEERQKEKAHGIKLEATCALEGPLLRSCRIIILVVLVILLGWLYLFY
jgi:hypothetical protein